MKIQQLDTHWRKLQTWSTQLSQNKQVFTKTTRLAEVKQRRRFCRANTSTIVVVVCYSRGLQQQPVGFRLMKSKLSHKLIIRRLCVNTSDITDEPLSIYPRPAFCNTQCHYEHPIIRTRSTFTYVQQAWGMSHKVLRVKGIGPCNFKNWISYTTQHSSRNAFLNWCRWPSRAIAPFLKTDNWFKVAYCHRGL